MCTTEVAVAVITVVAIIVLLIILKCSCGMNEGMGIFGPEYYTWMVVDTDAKYLCQLIVNTTSSQTATRGVTIVSYGPPPIPRGQSHNIATICLQQPGPINPPAPGRTNFNQLNFALQNGLTAVSRKSTKMRG